MLKFNGNQRYATTAITASILREISAKCSIPLQVIFVLCCHVQLCKYMYIVYFCISVQQSNTTLYAHVVLQGEMIMCNTIYIVHLCV